MKENNSINAHDDEFIERTHRAWNRVKNDNKNWLGVDKFLKELKSW